MRIADSFKNKFPKIKIDKDKAEIVAKKMVTAAKKASEISKKLKLDKIDNKTKISALVVVGVLIIAIAGRKSPKSNEWETLLPDSSVFDNEALGDVAISQSQDVHIKFFFEVYNLIKSKYWNVLTDEQLSNIVKLAIEKINGKPVTTNVTNTSQIEGVLSSILSGKSDNEKKEFMSKLVDVTLANLEPFGRSRLYTSQKQKELANVVKNVDPNTNHYDTLGVSKSASEEQIDTAYNEKLKELNTQLQTEEVTREKNKLSLAHEVLGDTGNKKVYDDLGVNPTIKNYYISPRIFYIHITKFSPTTVEELVRVMDKAEAQATNQLDTLIIDLRGNIGGAIDGLTYFLGPFIGKDQYAYQFYVRGEKEDYKTVTGWLPSLIRYKKVIVLIDEQVQSSGEVFAATLKKYNVGILVGVPTKGWGTVESVYKINNQMDPENEEYSVMLVHSLTLRDDGLTIEGKGVEPHVYITDPNWEQELNRYFNFPEITAAVRNLVNK